MAAQMPSPSRFVQRAASAVRNAPAQMAQTIRQTAVNEIKATAQDAMEQIGAPEMVQNNEPEPLRQGQLSNPEAHAAQVKQEETARFQQLQAMLAQEINKAASARSQTEQAYQRNVTEQMQAHTAQTESPVEAVMPASNRPSGGKNPEVAKKKH